MRLPFQVSTRPAWCTGWMTSGPMLVITVSSCDAAAAASAGAGVESESETEARANRAAAAAAPSRCLVLTFLLLGLRRGRLDRVGFVKPWKTDYTRLAALVATGRGSHETQALAGRCFR